MTNGDGSRGWDVLAEQELINCPPWVRVVKETLRLEDGQTVITDFYRVDLPDFVVVFALTTDRRVALVRQYRRALGRPVLELPAGAVADGEDPLLAAQRELREETGLRAAQWQPLGALTVDPNRGCGLAHAYLALDAELTAQRVDVDLDPQTVHFYTLDELREFWLSGECAVMGSAAVIGIGLARLEMMGIR